VRTPFSERFARNLLLPLEKGEFQEDLHPRDDDGKFARKGQPSQPGMTSQPTPEEIDEIFKKADRLRSLSPEALQFYQTFIEDMENKAQAIFAEDFTDGVPEGIIPVSEKAAAMADALGRKIQAEGKGKNEFIFAVDNKTGDVVGIARGSRATAPMSYIYNEMDRGAGYSVVHNHPSSDASFSDGDLAVFARTPQITRFVVESSEHRYILEKPAGWHVNKRPKNIPPLAVGYIKIEQATTSKYDPGPLPDGTRDPAKDAEAWIRHCHFINTFLAEAYGLKYRMEKR